MAERRKMLKLSSPADIRRALARLSNMVLNGELSPQKANCIVAACNAILSGIRLDEQQKKIDQLERIVEGLEKR